MLYTQEHKVSIIKASSQKTFDWWLMCRASTASACRKIGHIWFINGIFGENRAIWKQDAQLAAIPVARNPWPVLLTIRINLLKYIASYYSSTIYRCSTRHVDASIID